MVKSIRRRVLDREILAGTFLNLGSAVTAEIAGKSGLDWVLIDIEHGASDLETLRVQLQVVSGTPAVPIVRIAANEPPRFKHGVYGVLPS